jgi:hypothetical protein
MTIGITAENRRGNFRSKERASLAREVYVDHTLGERDTIMGRYVRKGAAVLAAVVVGLSMLIGLPGPAQAAVAAPNARSASAVDSAPSSTTQDFLDAVAEIMPSLNDKYSDGQLVKIAKSMCTSLRKGATIKQVDTVLRKHVSKSEALVLASLGAAAFCPSYYEKARRYYHIPA